MRRAIHWLAASLALLAPIAVRADIPPQPAYVAGLWFNPERSYDDVTHRRILGPLKLVDCLRASANCRAAIGARVVGAEVVSVDGDPKLDPREALARGHGPMRVTVVFRRPLPRNRSVLATVRFSRQ